MQTNGNPQYPNENRKKGNRRNVVFTACLVSAVAVAAAAVMVTMALAGRSEAPKLPGNETPPIVPVSSETVSSDVSSEASSEEESSTVPDINLPGTLGKITQSEDRLLVIVNNDLPLPAAFQSNLVTLGEVKVDKAMLKDYDAMSNASAEAKRPIWVTYGYRTEKEQNAIFRSNVQEMMDGGITEKEARKIAEKTIQRGGQSEYITGLSIGVNSGNDAFANTPEYKWMIEHCTEYGFILRYPKNKESITGIKYQPWRFRYVGREHAKAMKKLDLCLEEYVVYLNQQATGKSDQTVGTVTDLSE